VAAPSMRQALGGHNRGRGTLGLAHTREFLAKVLGDDVHARRVLSLANGVAGVLSAAALSIHAIGQGYAALAEITPKSAVKQVDRMLSNGGIDLGVVLPLWVQFVVGDSGRAIVALDWTDFDSDDHTTLCAYLVTDKGRATPLMWKTVKKSKLAGSRTAHERDLIDELKAAIPDSTKVTLLADRAFGNQDHYDLIEACGWDYVIRFRGVIRVEAAAGEAHRADAWLSAQGKARVIRDARVTADRAPVGAVVVVKAARMKEAWFLATSLRDAKAADIIRLYGRRFTIEETFRDTKDPRFGLGLSATHIRDPKKRDRLLFLVAAAHTLLTLLGAACEASGLDRYLKVNTVKRRTHSLFRQGSYWYSRLPTLREEWFRPLMTAFDQIIRQHAFFATFFGFK